MKFKKDEVKEVIINYFQNKKDNIIISSKNMKDKYLTWPPKINFRDALQKFAGGMMKSVILLIIVGFFVGIGTGFAELSTQGSFMHTVWSTFITVGFKVMGFLPLWFCLGLAFTIAKAEKGWVALEALFAYLSLISLIGVFAGKWTRDPLGISDVNGLWKSFAGIDTYNFGIFLGIIIGIWVAYIHNRGYKKELPIIFAFFSGPKWVMLKLAVYVIPFAFMTFWLWPLVDAAIAGIGKGITSSGLGGTFLFGALDKTLLPVGLHHLIAFPIEYSQAGGSMEIGGLTKVGAEAGTDIIKGTTNGNDWSATFHGVRNIINAQAGSSTATGYIVHNFTTGRLLFQLGGYGGVAGALILAAKKENRGRIATLTIPAALTAAFVGISEPIEYTFLFTAPILYFAIHVPLAGLAYVLAEVTEVSINGHSLFFMIPNLAQPDKVHAMSLLYLIPLYFALYFAAFYFAIIKFNFKTPGRGDDDSSLKLFSKADYLEKKDAKITKVQVKSVNLEDQIIKAFGGMKNINHISNCATRLRVTVNDSSKVVDKNVWTKELEAIGVVAKKNSFQIVYGPKVITIAQKIKEKLNIE